LRPVTGFDTSGGEFSYFFLTTESVPTSILCATCIIHLNRLYLMLRLVNSERRVFAHIQI